MKKFSLTKKKTPVVSTIPHSSTKLPAKTVKFFVQPKKVLQDEALFMGDLYTDELFKSLRKSSSQIVARFSRILVDIERFPQDDQEPMSCVGMGAVYTKLHDGRPLKKISSEDCGFLLDQYFFPYHQALEDLCEQALKTHDSCLIIDCHSFPNIPRSYEPDQTTPRPDICIGSDSFHTPPHLVSLLLEGFSQLGYSVAENSPFAGTLVPQKYYHTDARVSSLMIEVNRALYMDEITYAKKPGFKKVQEDIAHVVNDVLTKNSLL